MAESGSFNLPSSKPRRIAVPDTKHPSICSGVAVVGFVVLRRDMMAAASGSGEANHDRIAFVETLAHMLGGAAPTARCQRSHHVMTTQAGRPIMPKVSQPPIPRSTASLCPAALTRTTAPTSASPTPRPRVTGATHIEMSSTVPS